MLRYLPILVFLVLAPMAVLSRTESVFALAAGGTVPEQAVLQFHAADMLNMRVGGPLAFGVVEWLLHGAANLMMFAPEASPTFQGTPWDTYALGGDYVHRQVIPVMALIVYRVALLGLALWVTARLFGSPLIQALYVGATLLALGGWPPVAVDMIFATFSRLRDWPHAYYLFAHKLIFSDVAAMAFLLVLAGWLARLPRLALWQVAAVAAVGQLIYEHLGLVSGVAICVATVSVPALGHGRRWRNALLRLVVAGLSSSAVLAVLLATIGLKPNPDVPGDGLAALLVHQWVAYGHYNFEWWRVILANLASVLVLPLLAGAVIGLCAGVERPASRARDELLATLSVVAGLLCAMMLGAFYSGLAADLGRQSLPLVVLMVLVAAKAVQAWRGRRLS